MEEENQFNPPNYNTYCNQGKPTTIFNFFIIDSQLDIFSKEINSLIPEGILKREEVNENKKNSTITKLFYNKEQNRYNELHLIRLEDINYKTSFNLSSNNIFLMEENFFLFALKEDTSEERYMEQITNIFENKILKSIKFKEIGFFFQQKKNSIFQMEDYSKPNMNGDDRYKKFEIFKEKTQNMNISIY